MVHFPGLSIDLHIFEARYQRLVSDLLEQPEHRRLFAVPNVPYREPEGNYCRRTTLAHLTSFESLDDGRFLIRAIGLAPIRIGDEIAGRPYRRARISRITEDASLPARLVSRFERTFSTFAAETSLSTRGEAEAESSVPLVVRQVHRVCSDSGLPPSGRQDLLERPLLERFELALELLEKQIETLSLLRPFRWLHRQPELN